MDAPLLHMTSPAEWRAALAVGAIHPTVAEFVHLSTAEQVALPANRLHAAERDVYLLAVDPGRVGVPVAWEPGVPSDPASLRFPHAYGPVPTAAVLAVLAYRPDQDGVFGAPRLPPLTEASRAALALPSMLRRAATSESPVAGGVAIRTDPVPYSYQHNALLIDTAVETDELIAEADRALDGLDHRAVQLFGEALAATAADLAARGWEVGEQIGMIARPTGSSTGRVEQLDLDALRPFWDVMWRADLPHASDAARAQLSQRYLREEPVVDLRYLAVRENGEVVAAALLKIDGATAVLDALGTGEAHRGRGHGDALVTEALALAAAAGCDVLGLDADAGDWPRQWYARRGFTEASRSWFATTSPG
ncbi:MAG TPA: GNAT family N-acetyltransferase [Pseudonocardia sp.]